MSLPNHDAWQGRAASCSWLLDKIGIQKARHDFRPPRRAMQEKYSASPPGLRHSVSSATSAVNPAEKYSSSPLGVRRPPLTVIIRAPRPAAQSPPAQSLARPPEASGGRVRRAGLRTAGRPLRRTSRPAPIDRRRGTGASANIPAIGGLGMDIGARDKPSEAPPKKREKNRARPDVPIKSQTVIGARPNRARWIPTAAPGAMKKNIGMTGCATF